MSDLNPDNVPMLAPSREDVETAIRIIINARGPHTVSWWLDGWLQNQDKADKEKASAGQA